MYVCAPMALVETPEDLPGSDGGNANPADRGELKGVGNAPVRFWPHHLGNHIGVQKICGGFVHAPSSPSNSTGR